MRLHFVETKEYLMEFVDLAAGERRRVQICHLRQQRQWCSEPQTDGTSLETLRDRCQRIWDHL